MPKSYGKSLKDYLPTPSHKVPSKQTSCIGMVFENLLPHFIQFFFIPGSVSFEISLKLLFDHLFEVFLLSVSILVFRICLYILIIFIAIEIINNILNAFTNCFGFPLKCKLLIFLLECSLYQWVNVFQKLIQVHLLEMTSKYSKNRAQFSVLRDEPQLQLVNDPNLGFVRIFRQ